MRARIGPRPIILAAVFAVYVIVGKLELTLSFLSPGVSAVAPSAGIALAAILFLGYRVWPAVFVGAAVVNMGPVHSAPAAVAMSVGSTGSALLGAHLITRFAGGRKALRTAQGILRFAGLAALAITAVSAPWGVLCLSLGRAANWVDYGSIWTTLWLSNLAGVWLVAPVAMLWATEPLTRLPARKLYEAAVLAATLVAVGWAVFGGVLPEEFKSYPLEFLCVPLLSWAAFRFGRREAATSVALMSAIAVWGTLQGHGPFVRDTPNASMLLMQAFMGVTAVMTLALSALVTEHAQAEAQLREMAVTDALTGLPNYRKLLEVLRKEIARADRSGDSFALLFMDMDGLKRINDQHGHLAGSRAVCRVAETLRQSCRATDTSARFGGDEFVIVLPRTDDAGARIVAQRVSDRLANDGDAPAITISTGVAVYPRDGGTPAALLSAADHVLYEAKSRKTARHAPAAPMPEWGSLAIH